MKTVGKMLATVMMSAGLTTWYLSYRPRPLSHEDAIFLVVSSAVAVWITYLIWRIDGLREDLETLKAKA